MLSSAAMFAIALRAFLFLELLLHAGLDTWLVVGLGWSLAGAVGLSLAIVIGVRVGLTLLSFAIAQAVHSPRRPELRIGPLRTLGMLASECATMVRFQVFDCPWEHLALRPDPPVDPCSTTPVLAVHGYMGNRGYLRPMVAQLEAAGLGPVFAPDFTTWFATIEHFADEIHREVERIVAGTGQPKVLLVVHSMGGLGARSYLARHGAGRVARLVTVCSPHHGTALAPFGLGENARQMRRGSAFLTDLERRESGAAPVPTTCIYSTHDNLVSPQRTATLEWAGRNVAFPGLGHVSILADRGAGDAIVAALRG